MKLQVRVVACVLSQSPVLGTRRLSAGDLMCPHRSGLSVKMVMIQDGPLLGADKPLRMRNPFKVQWERKPWVRQVPGVVASLGGVLVMFYVIWEIVRGDGP